MGSHRTDLSWSLPLSSRPFPRYISDTDLEVGRGEFSCFWVQPTLRSCGKLQGCGRRRLFLRSSPGPELSLGGWSSVDRCRCSFPSKMLLEVKKSHDFFGPSDEKTLLLTCVEVMRIISHEWNAHECQGRDPTSSLGLPNELSGTSCSARRK